MYRTRVFPVSYYAEYVALPCITKPEPDLCGIHGNFTSRGSSYQVIMQKMGTK